MHGDHADAAGVDVVYITLLLRGYLDLHGRGREQARIIDRRGVSALRGDEFGEHIFGRSVRDGALEHGLRRFVVFRDAGRREDAGAERVAELHELARSCAGEGVDRLAHLEGVAHSEAERLVHVRDDGDGLLAGALADGDKLGCERAGVVLRLHEGAAAALDVEHDDVRARGELLGHDAARDQRDARDGAGHVAQGVELLVRRDEVRRLPGDDHADVLDVLIKLLEREIRGKAGKALELVDRAAGVAEAAAGHLGHLDAAGRHHRHEDERGLVPHAAGGVLVRLDAGDAGEVDRLAAVEHGEREIERLAPVHAAKIDRHRHGGHLIVRHGAVDKAADHPLNLLGCQLAAVAFFHDQVVHLHPGHAPFLLCLDNMIFYHVQSGKTRYSRPSITRRR